MAKDTISAKFLIHLVGERPALWDKTSEDYRDRSLRETSWREICTFANEDFERMTPRSKEAFTRMIVRKWTSIRDSWVKSMKYGYDEVTKKPEKPYIYHNELKFLQKILKCKRQRYDFNPTYLSNDDFCGYKTETQISAGDLTCIDNNGEEGDENAGVVDNHNENEDAVKQETEPKTQSTHIVENHENNTSDDEDWPTNDVDTSPIIKPNKQNNENEYKRPRISPSFIKTRSSIFVDAPRKSENKEETTTPATFQFQTKPIKTLPPTTNRRFKAYADKSYSENRHLNFFKGILPSLCSLDEDHTLQFQAGVISLIQNLRESQSRRMISKCGKRGGRKRKISANDDPEWPEQTINASGRFFRRSTINNEDPIAADETEYSTD